MDAQIWDDNQKSPTDFLGYQINLEELDPAVNTRFFSQNPQDIPPCHSTSTIACKHHNNRSIPSKVPRVSLFHCVELFWTLEAAERKEMSEIQNGGMLRS